MSPSALGELGESQPRVSRRSGPGRVGTVLLSTVATLLVALAACSTVSALVDLTTALEEAGFDSPNVNTGSNIDQLTIDASAPPGDPVDEAQVEAAEITWNTFELRFESLEVTIDGASRTFDRDELRSMFGPRPEGFDENSLSGEVEDIGVGVLIALGVGGVLCLGIVGLVIWLLVRSSRKKKAQQAQQWGGPGGPGPQGGPPSWGPPPAQPETGPLAPPSGFEPPGGGRSGGGQPDQGGSAPPPAPPGQSPTPPGQQAPPPPPPPGQDGGADNDRPRPPGWG